MFGQYKRLRNEFTGVLTGKKPAWGGSLIRPEATGYGATYFMAEMLAIKDESIDGKTVVISGSGNVALHAAEKCLRLGGKGDCPERQQGQHLTIPQASQRKNWLGSRTSKRYAVGASQEYADAHEGVTFRAGQDPWDLPATWPFPAQRRTSWTEQKPKPSWPMAARR